MLHLVEKNDANAHMKFGQDTSKEDSVQIYYGVIAIAIVHNGTHVTMCILFTELSHNLIYW